MCASAGTIILTGNIYGTKHTPDIGEEFDDFFGGGKTVSVPSPNPSCETLSVIFLLLPLWEDRETEARHIFILVE
jgi:hypothetical protein